MTYDRAAKFKPKEKPQSDALEALEQLRKNISRRGLGSFDADYFKTIREDLEQGQRAQQIVDLMEQGNDIAFVSEIHGEFIYRTQHSLASQQHNNAIRDLSGAAKKAKEAIEFMPKGIGRGSMSPVYTSLIYALTTHAETIKRAGGE